MIVSPQPPSRLSLHLTSHPRQIKSYVLRQGRITKGQARALQTQWPLYGLELKDGTLNLPRVFGRTAPTILEIGFGMGDSLVEQAQQQRDKNFIGIEVHSAGVGHLLGQAAENKLNNLRVYQADAIDVLTQCIENEALHRVHLFFPDPWPKKKHHKRRLVQPAFINLIHEKLVPGGVMHIATDWQAYAEHCLAVFSERTDFANCATGQQTLSEQDRCILTVGKTVMPRPQWRPLTKFERRGQRLGHGVWDLLFKKR